MADQNGVCNCLVGTPYVENGVCKCATESVVLPPTYPQPPLQTGSNRRNPSVIYLNQSPQPTTSTTNIFSDFSLVNWVREHPFVIAGGVALLIYFFFIARGRTSKVRTDITKWGE